MSYEKITQQFAAVLADNNNIVYVAEVAPGEIIGFAFGGANRAKRISFAGEIYALYVLKEYENKGVGHLLVNAVADAFAELNVG